MAENSSPSANPFKVRPTTAIELPFFTICEREALKAQFLKISCGLLWLILTEPYHQVSAPQPASGFRPILREFHGHKCFRVQKPSQLARRASILAGVIFKARGKR